MNLKRLQECERSKIEKWSEFQLDNKWKKRGVVFCLLIFIAIIVFKSFESQPVWLMGALKKSLLIGLLIISLSKEKIEDEMVTSLRAKSFILAFIFGVLYVIIQPLVDIFVSNILLEPNPEDHFSYFEVLSFMLGIQIAFFEVLKRNR